MKKIIFIILLSLILLFNSAKASLPLSGKLIIIDVGHGNKDVGTSYNNILEKELNLEIAKLLEIELIKNGSSVILTREDDYDLSSANSKRRKKSDFDNRIKFINESKADLYLSIHINYLDDKSYLGAQVFYLKDNMKLANTIQKELNTISYPRSIKKMPDVYMYKKLSVKGVLIECGFISNKEDREKLLSKEYQRLLSNSITKGVIKYFN